MGNFGAMRRDIVEPGEHACERAGEAFDTIRDHRQAERREPRRIAIGVEHEPRALRREPRDEPRQDRLAPTSISALSAPPMRRANPPARMIPKHSFMRRL